MALNTNTIAAWRCDESSGNPQDSSSTNHLTNNNVVAFVSWKVGNAWDFWSANTTKYFDIASALWLWTYQADTWSVRRWVNITTAPVAWEIQNIFGLCNVAKSQTNFGYANNGWTLQLQYTNFNGITAETFTWTQTFTTWAWYDVWLIKNGTTLTAYVDGASLWTRTITIADASPARASQFTLWRAAFDVWSFMKGLVDEVTVWSDAKLLADVTEAYNAGAWKVYPFPSAILWSAFLLFL